MAQRDTSRDKRYTRSIILDVFKAGPLTWRAEWRPKDDPSYKDWEEEHPGYKTYVSGFTRSGAILKATRLLEKRGRRRAQELVAERLGDETFLRVPIQIDVTELRLQLNE